jgi:hypothetical protein
MFKTPKLSDLTNPRYKFLQRISQHPRIKTSINDPFYVGRLTVDGSTTLIIGVDNFVGGFLSQTVDHNRFEAYPEGIFMYKSSNTWEILKHIDKELLDTEETVKKVIDYLLIEDPTSIIKSEGPSGFNPAHPALYPYHEMQGYVDVECPYDDLTKQVHVLKSRDHMNFAWRGEGFDSWYITDGHRMWASAEDVHVQLDRPVTIDGHFLKHIKGKGYKFDMLTTNYNFTVVSGLLPSGDTYAVYSSEGEIPPAKARTILNGYSPYRSESSFIRFPVYKLTELCGISAWHPPKPEGVKEKDRVVMYLLLVFIENEDIDGLDLHLLRISKEQGKVEVASDIMTLNYPHIDNKAAKHRLVCLKNLEYGTILDDGRVLAYRALNGEYLKDFLSSIKKDIGDYMMHIPISRDHVLSERGVYNDPVVFTGDTCGDGEEGASYLLMGYREKNILEFIQGSILPSL